VRRTAAGGALLASVLVFGCGGVKAPDLFIAERTGTGPGAALTIVVNEEGGVHCNGGPTLKLSDSALIDARAIQEEISEYASKHTALPPAPQSVLSYRLRDENGSVSFSDNSAHQPKVFRQLALFVLQTAQQVCHRSE
jgi:hypothetical protein